MSSSPIDGDNNIEAAAMQSLLENVDASIQRASIAGIPATVVLAALYWPWANRTGTVVALLLVAASMLPYFIWMKCRKSGAASLTTNSLAFFNAITCIAFAFTPWLMMPEQGEAQFFLVCFAFAIMVSNIADSAALRAVHLTSQIPMVIILALGFAIEADGIARLMSLLIVLVGVYLDTVARQWSDTAIRSARLHCKNEELVNNLRDANAILRYRSTHDHLTELPNRAAFSSFLAEALATTTPTESCKIAVMLIDIDGFKQVNDTFGHQAGDQLLIEAADLIQGCTPPDSLIARFGGDEFALAWRDVPSRSDLDRLAARINETMRERFEATYPSLAISVSIGMTIGDAANASESQLFRRADIALYAAKKDGKDCSRFFRPDLVENGTQG